MCQVLNVDPWDMPNNFCFDVEPVEAENSVFWGENGNGIFYSTRLLR